METTKQFTYALANGLADIPTVIIGAVVLATLAMVILTYIVNAFLLSYLFRKTGVSTWKAWIPLYQYWPILEMGGQKGYWAFFLLIPPISIPASVYLCIAMYHIGLKLGKQGRFVVLGIIAPTVWVAWLAFDGSKWPQKKSVSVKGGLKD